MFWGRIRAPEVYGCDGGHVGAMWQYPEASRRGEGAAEAIDGVKRLPSSGVELTPKGLYTMLSEDDTCRHSVTPRNGS